MRTSLFAAIVLTGLATGAASLSALAGGMSFHADAMQSFPGKDKQTGRLYVSPEGGRFEYEIGGRKVVELRPQGQGKMIVLLTGQKQFMEMPAPPGGLARGPAQPCQPAPNLACTRTPGEVISGISTEKWVMQPKGAAKPMIIFWDPKRRIAIRRIFPDGRIAEMRRQADSKHENRPVEQWALVVKSAGKEEKKATMLYDPELAMMVAENHANGYRREIRNIKTGPLDPSLFKVPQGYQKTALPRGSGAMPPAGQR